MMESRSRVDARIDDKERTKDAVKIRTDAFRNWRKSYKITETLDVLMHC